jgi:excinuclease Cho
MPPDLSGFYEYPRHIDRDSIDALPAKPGVYLFLDRHGEPVYIGKSVSIRSRVLSHLRTLEEAAMLNETATIDFMRTAGEIGALLQESQLIKLHQPKYNALLKHVGETFSLRLDDGDARPRIVGSWEPDGSGDDLCGLYQSRGAAGEGLRALLREYRLCPALCGLETATHGRACFSCQIGRCAGACIGKEPKEAHLARLRLALSALQASVWPYAGPVGIVERSDGWSQTHVVDRWAYLGSLEGRRRKVARPREAVADIDTYKILARPMRSGQLEIVPMEPRAAGRGRGTIPTNLL